MDATFRIGEWLVDPFHGRIAGPGGTVRLEPRVMRVLVCLAERSGEVVSREQLMHEVWEGTFVSDEVLTQSISELRKALGEAPTSPRFIQTVPKQGYRIIVPILAAQGLDRSPKQLEDAPESANPNEADTESSTEIVPAEKHRWTRFVWLAAAVLLLVVATLVVRSLVPSADPRVAMRVALTLSPTALSNSLALSPDGKWLAFITADEAGNAISLRELETGETRELAGTNGVLDLFWSPDSRFIAFATIRTLRKVSLVGGPSELLREGEYVFGGTWGERGEIVVTRVGELYRVPAVGGEPVPVTLDDGEQARIRPFFLPDGDHFLYFAMPPVSGTGRILVGSLSSSETKLLVESDSKAIYADGHLLFVRNGILTAQRFDAETLELRDDPYEIGPQLLSSDVLGWSETPFSASRDGLLAYRGGSGAMGQLVWFDRQGAELGRIPQPGSGEYLNPTISPDGRTVAVNRRDPTTGNHDVWLIDVESGIASRFTRTPSPEVDPVWSPDGRRIAFASRRDGRWGAWIKDVATGAEELVWETPGEQFFLSLSDWSSDGRYLLAFARNDIWVLPISANSEPWSFAANSPDARDYAAHFSPDGKWIAYASSETGAFEIYVVRFPEGDHKRRVSDRGGVHPLWGADGRELFYWPSGEDSQLVSPLMKVEMPMDATGFLPSLPTALFEPRLMGLLDARNHFAVSPDGRRFLLHQPVRSPPPVTVIAGWALPGAQDP